MNEIQKELDKVEEFILGELFGDIYNPQVSRNLQFVLNFKGIDLNKFLNSGITMFENFVKNYMREDGFLDTQKIIKVLSVNLPFLEGLNPPVVRLIDVAKFIDKKIIPFRMIGEIIRKI